MLVHLSWLRVWMCGVGKYNGVKTKYVRQSFSLKTIASAAFPALAQQRLPYSLSLL